MDYDAAVGSVDRSAAALPSPRLRGDSLSGQQS